MTSKISLLDTIQRCPHDAERPYTQINNDLIRDVNISPLCRLILIYLFSQKNGWKINVKQVADHLKNFHGRDQVYKAFDEAIKSGYMIRKEYLEGNFKRFLYYISETPKFKKCLLFPERQETDAPYTEVQGRLERTYKERIYKETTTTASRLPASPIVVVPLSNERAKGKKVAEDYSHVGSDNTCYVKGSPIIRKDEQQIRELLKPYSLSPSAIKEFISYNVQDVKTSIAAYEQLAEKEATLGALISSLRFKWKPNIRKADIQKEKEKEKLEFSKLEEKNRKEVLSLVKKHEKDLYGPFQITVSDKAIFLKYNYGYSPISMFSDDCIPQVKGYLQNFVCIKNI